MTSSRLLLLFTIFVLLFPQNFSAPSTQTSILPLKTTSLGQGPPRASPGNFKRSAPVVSNAAFATKKVAFQRNVALTVSLSVGVPPQNVTMVLSTGSELSWLQCKKAPTLHSIFNPQASQSYKPIPCSSPVCKATTPGLVVPSSCDQTNKFCRMAVSYVDGSSSEGTLAYENFVIGSVRPSMFLFGCMDTGSSSTSAEEESETTGIMGMNLGSLSFAKQMSLPKFSYCIPSSDSSGVLLFGDATFPWLQGLKYTPLIQKSDPLPSFDRLAYSVQLEGIKVGNEMLMVPKTAFSIDFTGAGQTMIDSSTQFSLLRDPVYTALKNEFLKQTNGVLKVYEDTKFVFQRAMDLCFQAPASSQASFSKLPLVTLVFQGAEMTVSGEKLLYQVPEMNKGSDSVYCLTFGSSALLGIEAFVIGNYHQQNVWMEFDLAQSRVGFTEMKCDLASQNLGMSH